MPKIGNNGKKTDAQRIKGNRASAVFALAQPNPQQYLIAGNGEHGLLPVPTPGKRTPIMPYINRSFYENEFNREANRYFLAACLRQGFRVLNVSPELTDVPLQTRVQRANSAGATVLVTFAYNAFGDGLTFNAANGLAVYYSPQNPQPAESRRLATDLYERLIQGTRQMGLGVQSLENVYVLRAAQMPSALIEAGFMTNFVEAKLMMDPDFQREVGEQACAGACDFLGVPYIQPPPMGVKPVLRFGSRGEYVRYLQFKLASKLFYGGRIDGVFGLQTQSAVRQFQRENGLVADGVVGPRTWAALSIIGGGRGFPG